MSEAGEGLATTASGAAASERTAASASPDVKRPSAPDIDEEVDVWWGAYCGWTMMPSMIVCIVLTGLIALGVWLWVPRDYMQLAFVGVGGALWIAQAVRWAVHVFGRTYRLTTRRLYVDCGLFRCRPLNVDLHEIA